MLCYSEKLFFVSGFIADFSFWFYMSAKSVIMGLIQSLAEISSWPRETIYILSKIPILRTYSFSHVNNLIFS